MNDIYFENNYRNRLISIIYRNYIKITKCYLTQYKHESERSPGKNNFAVFKNLARYRSENFIRIIFLI